MRTIAVTVLLLSAACLSGWAQQWEVGGVGGLGFLNRVNVTAPAGAATAGFAPGVSAGVFFGQTLYPKLAGEIHYDFFQSNQKISGGGASETFSGIAHAIHYDLVFHTNRAHSPVQFFAVVGGGMKIFQGTGKEAIYRPTDIFGYFTKTHVLKPMAAVGGGITYQLGPRLYLRTQILDFISAFPSDLIAPAPGTKYGNLLNDLVPTVGLTYVF